MHVFRTRNVHSVLPEAIRYMAAEGQLRDSRNGPVLVAPCPVTTLYERPRERVLFWPQRDGNPFFHLFESLWMLSGRDDVAFPAHYASNIRSYSDDGVVLHGAYGKRWRDWFHPADGVPGDADQLRVIAEKLAANPDDRRCVLQMWDGYVDLCHEGKDVPCNTNIYFGRNKSGALDMTVCCRSNDMIWGAYGANAVHMSVLQEFMAAAIGCPVGHYWQLSNNFHAYLKTFEPLRGLADEAADTFRGEHNPYAVGSVEPFPLVATPVTAWLEDLAMYLEHGPIVGLRDPFFRRVVTPMHHAHAAYSVKNDPARYDKALEIIHQCQATDWRLACTEWLVRRREKATIKKPSPQKELT
jgi:hypothetical protein